MDDDKSLSRRNFLAAAAGGASLIHVAVKAPIGLPGTGGLVGNLIKRAFTAESAAGDAVIQLRRREDGLNVRLEWVNFSLVGNTLQRRNTKPAFLVVTFPPQHMSEEVLTQLQEDQLVQHGGDGLPRPVRHRISGVSRLVFKIPDAPRSLSFKIEDALNFAQYSLSVVPTAYPRDEEPAYNVGHILTAPTATQTAIEVPYHLVLSPASKNALWLNRARPLVGPTGWSELWHAGLWTAPVGGAARHEGNNSVRAIWSMDPGFKTALYPSTGEPKTSSTYTSDPLPVDSHRAAPMPSPLSPKDRYDIVRATSDTRGRLVHLTTTSPTTDFVPKPVQTDRLLLSPLGAWLDVDGQWLEPNSTAGIPLQSWRHRATMGRDQYVRVVDRGYLYPYGHRAVLLKTTERQFDEIAGRKRNTAAFLHQRYHLVVMEKSRTYPGFNDPLANRRMPFTAIEITRLESPSLTFTDEPHGFTPIPIALPMTGTDWIGNRVHFESNVAFVPADLATPTHAGDTSELEAAIAGYGPIAVDLRSQLVAIAPVDAARPGSTSVRLNSMNIVGFAAPAPVSDEYATHHQPIYYPTMVTADAVLEAPAALAGTPAPTTTIRYATEYITKGLTAPSGHPVVGNEGALFAQVVGEPPAVSFGDTSRAGGVIRPDMRIQGLSRVFGTVVDTPASAATGAFNPASAFAGLDAAKLLGVVPLTDVFSPATAASEALTLHTERHPDRVDVVAKWAPAVRSTGAFVATAATSFTLEALTSTPLPDPTNPSNSLAPHVTVRGDLRDFALHLLGDADFLMIGFDRLAFESFDGGTPTTHVAVGDVEFLGALRFIDELRKFLSANSAPAVSVSPAGVRVATGLPIPSVTLGLFSLTNLSFAAEFNIHFDGSPVTARFAFSSKPSPFQLSIGPFGGRGYFAMELTAGDLTLMEGALEFGAAMAINFGPVSGEAHLTAGVYFSYTQALDPETLVPSGPTTVQLAGYFSVGGSLSVAGLIGVSLEFTIALGYIHVDPGDKNILYGKATVHLEVHVIFTVSVDFELERHFGGDPADPTFQQMVSQSQWEDYVHAFDPYVDPTAPRG